MKNRVLFILLIAVLILSACATKANAPDQYVGAPVGVGGGDVPQSQRESIAPSMDGSVNGAKTDNSSTQLQDRIVIQNADLTVVVADPEAKLAAISKMAVEMGGFVVSSSISQSYTAEGKPVPQGYITVRVPATKLDAALGEIQANAVEVRGLNRTGEDVTQNYIDLNSQLKSMQAAADQLTLIMQKAEKTEDVLNVFSQLQSYNQQIDVIKGQIQYYDQASKLSAITTTLIAEETIKPIEIGSWKPKGVARDAIQSLINFWQKFVDFLINLFLLILPILITVLLPLYLIFLAVRAILRRRQSKKTPPTA